VILETPPGLSVKPSTPAPPGCPLKQPKVVGHAAMLRQFRECILGKATPGMGGQQGILLMQMIEALYRSAETGKSVAL
jgi:predicted dehydrogenase